MTVLARNVHWCRSAMNVMVVTHNYLIGIKNPGLMSGQESMAREVLGPRGKPTLLLC